MTGDGAMMDQLVHFLHLHQFVPSDLLVVLVLIILEGLLSCDNAVVLALLVRDLPPEQRGRALRYGIIGAYVFRVIALLLATWIMSTWWLKMFGGVYLLYLAVAHFLHRQTDDDKVRPVRAWFGLSAFWSAVIAVELTDIVFSVDSIAASVALSNKLWVLILGGFIGILAMRFAAQGFVKLLESFPGLETAAFIAVAIIGAKLVLELPADVVGLRTPPPAIAIYGTATAYERLAIAVNPPFLHIPHVITLNRRAAFAPDRAIMLKDQRTAFGTTHSIPAAEREAKAQAAAEREYRIAQARWNLHLRPLVEIEGWMSSLLVLLVFAGGFWFGRRKRITPR